MSIKEYENRLKEKIIIILSILIIIETLITIRMWVLYEPNATIVLHDYGQIFETITDWKLWRIEHNK